jgi:hypothetical protein
MIINGEKIDDAVFDQEFHAIKNSYERMGTVNCCERDDEFRGYARENIVGRVLLAQEARRVIGNIATADIDQALANLKEQHGGSERFYINVGMTPDDDPIIRRDIETSLRVQKLVKQITDSAGEPTDADLRAYYIQHESKYLTPEEVSALHLIKRPLKIEERENVYNTMRHLRTQILEGADFKQLAYEHCDSVHELDDGAGEAPGSNRTIELGFFKRGEMMEEFEVIAFSMKVGEVSPVFPSMYGFHLLKLTGHKPPVPRPFDEVQPEVLQHFTADRQERLVRDLVGRLKSAAKIEEPAEV